MSTIKLLESTPTKFQKVSDTFGAPVIFFNHLGAVLDHFDARIISSREAISTGVTS